MDGSNAEIIPNIEHRNNPAFLRRDIAIGELLHVIQFYNTPAGLGCETGTEDGYCLG